MEEPNIQIPHADAVKAINMVISFLYGNDKDNSLNPNKDWDNDTLPNIAEWLETVVPGFECDNPRYVEVPA